MRLKIRHNMEMAHRLSKDTTKCRQIHGHGMQVELVLMAEAGVNGMAMNAAGETLEFGDMKRKFRNHIDSTYDHRLVLNQEDIWAGPIYFHGEDWENGKQEFLPGLSLVPDEPTVENLAMWIAQWACSEFRCDVICRIDETKTNGAEVMFHWNGFGASMMKGAR
jgi:6-pyruvoyl-tetrahydropterin synthase